MLAYRVWEFYCVFTRWNLPLRHYSLHHGLAGKCFEGRTIKNRKMATIHLPQYELDSSLLYNKSWFGPELERLFTPGINMRPGCSNHKWTALSSSGNVPKMLRGCVVQSFVHSLSAVCPGPHWRTVHSADVLQVHHLVPCDTTYFGHV